MAEDMNLKIVLEAINSTSSAFEAMDGALRGIQSLADNASQALEALIEPLERDASKVATVFDSPARDAEQQLRQIAEGLKNIETIATEEAAKIRTVFEEPAKQASGELAKVADGLKDVDISAQKAAEAVVKDFEQAARDSEKALEKINVHPSGPSGGGHGNEGLFGIQGQMDTMYAGMSLGAAAAPLDLGIGASVDQFAKFDQSMRLVNEEMGLGENQFKSLEQSVIQLSNSTGISADQLAQGLYNVVATGITDASQAMTLLKTSAEGAKAGNTDLDTATRALNAVMGAYGLSAKDASGIMDVMFTAVNNGQMHFDDLARSVGASATSAATAGVSYTELAAAQATLTNVGKNAESASQNLNSLLVGIIAPTGEATKEAKKLGIEWDAAALKQHGLTYMINEAIKATGGNTEELKKLLPNQRAYMAVLALGENANKQYTDTLKQMQDAHGATGKALEEFDKGAGDQIEKMKTSVQNAAIALGTALAPAIALVTNAISGLAHWFSSLSPSTQEFLGIAMGLTAAVTSLGAIFFLFLSGIGGFVSGFNALANAFKEVSAAESLMEALNPIGWIVLAVVAVIGLAAAIITYWEPIKTFAEKLWQDIEAGTERIWTSITSWLSQTWNNMKTSAENIWTGLVKGIQNLWSGFKTWINTEAHAALQFVVDAFNWMYNHNYYFQELVDFIRTAWTTIQTDATMIWTAITTFLTGAWNTLITDVNSIWTPIKSFFSGLWNDISLTASELWNGIQTTLGGLWQSTVNDAQSIFNQLGTYFTNLWNEAEQWGANVVHMIAQGIQNAAHEVADAAKNVAHNIASFLGFHSPTEDGPGSDADQWMPNMMNMFISGIQSHIPQLQSVLNAAISNPFTSANEVVGNSISQNIAYAGGTGYGGGTVINYITVQGHVLRENELAKIVSRGQWNNMKQQAKFSP